MFDMAELTRGHCTTLLVVICGPYTTADDVSTIDVSRIHRTKIRSHPYVSFLNRRAWNLLQISFYFFDISPSENKVILENCWKSRQKCDVKKMNNIVVCGPQKRYRENIKEWNFGRVHKSFYLESSFLEFHIKGGRA